MHVQYAYCSAVQFPKDELVCSLPPSGIYPALTPNTSGYKTPNSITDAGFFGSGFSFINPQRCDRLKFVLLGARFSYMQDTHQKLHVGQSVMAEVQVDAHYV